jgi:hypothetical protein
VAANYAQLYSWAGLSRASAFAVALAGVPQHRFHRLLTSACLDYAPQVHTYQEMQQRLELGRQLAPHLQGVSETWLARCASTGRCDQSTRQKRSTSAEIRR